MSFTKRFLFCSLLFFVLFPTAQANGSRFLMGAAFGNSWLNLNHSTSIVSDPNVVPPFNVDRYSIGAKQQLNLSLFAGMQWQDCWQYAPYVSVAFQYWFFMPNNISGHVRQYNLPQFSNYHYKMRLFTNALDIVGKWDIWQYQQFLPYVSLGVGFASTKVSDYREHALPGVIPARVSPAFRHHHSFNFNYVLGAGVDYILNDCTWLTLGYEYFYLNNVKTANGRNTWQSADLNFGRLKANTIFISITSFLNGLS